MAALPAGSVDAVVTSPPYADAREEVAAAFPETFAQWMVPFFEGMGRVLHDDGSIMLNLGRLFRRGVELDYIERTLFAAQELGWKRIDTIVWAKVNARPINPYLTNVHEYVYWLTRSPNAVVRNFTDVRYPYAPETLLRYQRAWTNHANRKSSDDPRDEVVQEGRDAHPDGARPRSVYITQVGKEKGILHPTPMDLDLACFLVGLSTPQRVCEFCGPLLSVGISGVMLDGSLCRHSPTRWRKAVVLDPFFGSGQTGAACRLLGRDCVGIELSPEYAAEAAERLGQKSLF